ncbi:MAG: RNA polymerase sigma factor (sigma-70 family) [Spirosomataceae bacterium]|jgi:RNA polymerase sigma factor (sigma-70 family)
MLFFCKRYRKGSRLYARYLYQTFSQNRYVQRNRSLFNVAIFYNVQLLYGSATVDKKRAEYELNENFDESEEEDYELLEMKAAGLKESMKSLNAEEQAILIMKYQDDFSIKEISEAFDLTESAVKMRLMRTWEKVKKVYLENFTFLALLFLKK